jgi:MFS family permease
VLLTGGLTLVVLGVLEGGQSWGWVSVPSVSVFAVGLVLLIAFGLVEPRAAEPILPLGVLRDRLVLSTSLAAAALGANLIGLSSYIPAYLQDVLGTGPLVAGFTLAALTLAWPVTASQSGRLYLRFGFRTASIVGSCAAVVATAFLLLLGRDSSVGTVAGVCFGIGLGMGLVSSTTVIAAQMYVQWNERGVVTGTNMFFRAMGSAVGVAVFGAIANRTVRTSTGGHVDPGALAVAVHHIFIATLVVAALMLVVSWAMPRQPLGQQRTDTGEQAVATAIAEQA